MSASLTVGALHVHGRGEQLARGAAGGDRQHDRVHMHAGGALGGVDRVAQHFLGRRDVDHGAGLHALRLGVADAEHLDRMGAARQHVLRRARLQPRDHADDLAGADVERAHDRGAPARDRLHLRGKAVREIAHASPPFFLVCLLDRVLARLRDAVGEAHGEAVGEPQVDRRDVAGEQVLLAVEPRQRRQRALDVGLGQPHVDAVLQPQVPAPLARPGSRRAPGRGSAGCCRASRGNRAPSRRRPCPTTNGSAASRGSSLRREHRAVGGDHRDLAVQLPQRERLALRDGDLQPVRIELAHGRFGDPRDRLEPGARVRDIEEQQRGIARSRRPRRRSPRG